MKTRNVLLMISPSQPERFAGIAAAAREFGWNLTIERNAPTGSRTGRWDGVLAMVKDDDPATVRFVRGLVRGGTPVVDLVENRPDVKLPRVCGDSEAMGRLAAEHFREHAFEHAVFFSSGWSNVHRLRHRSFARAMGGEVGRWVWAEHAPHGKTNDWDAFVRWTGRLLSAAPKPLAVFCYSDYDAMRLAGACRENDVLVPDEVAILGVDDNTLICENQPVPLSSIRHDLREIGLCGAKLLNRRMDGAKAPAKPLRISPRGITRRRSTDTIAVRNPMLQRAMAEIERSLSDRSLSAGTIAGVLGIPRVRLDRLFATELGRPVGAEIRRHRLAAVKRLLSETDYPLDAIALDCGFCHSSHLIRAFRLATGHSPHAWRLQRQPRSHTPALH